MALLSHLPLQCLFAGDILSIKAIVTSFDTCVHFAFDFFRRCFCENDCGGWVLWRNFPKESHVYFADPAEMSINPAQKVAADVPCESPLGSVAPNSSQCCITPKELNIDKTWEQWGDITAVQTTTLVHDVDFDIDAKVDLKAHRWRWYGPSSDSKDREVPPSPSRKKQRYRQLPPVKPGVQQQAPVGRSWNANVPRNREAPWRRAKLCPVPDSRKPNTVMCHYFQRWPTSGRRVKEFTVGQNGCRDQVVCVPDRPNIYLEVISNSSVFLHYRTAWCRCCKFQHVSHFTTTSKHGYIVGICVQTLSLDKSEWVVS